LFNNWSVQSTIFKGNFKKIANDSSCLNQATLQNMYKSSVPPAYYFATAANISRRWTYPSGAPNGFLAVSVHPEPGKSVFGAIQPITFDDVVLSRSREADYDYIVLGPNDLTVQWNESTTTTLQQAYPGECTAVFPFAYGFQKVVTTTPDIFKDIPTMNKKYNPPDDGVLKLIARRNVSCAALAPGHVEACKTTMEANKGFVLVQSYIDVILSGLLDADPSGKAARAFVSTTIWPLQELRESKLFYIDDRACPQNGNPLYTPPEHLESGFNAGTSSVYKNDIEGTWQKADALLQEAGILEYRIARLTKRNCISLGMAGKDLIVRFTDEFVYGKPEVNIENNEAVRMVSPWQEPFI